MSNETNATVAWRSKKNGALAYNIPKYAEAWSERVICIPVAEARKLLTDINTQARATEGRKLTKESKRIINKARALIAAALKEEKA